MSKIQTLRKLWHSDKTAILTACFNNLNNWGLFRWMGDKTFLSFAYYMHTGRKMNWKKPVRFTEKIQWLKLYDRKSEYTRMVDKISAKDYVADIIGREYIIPTYGVWNTFDEIDFDQLPEQFVLKTSNGSGSNGVVVCTDKTKFDKVKAKKRLESSLRCNTYLNLREWPYKNIVPRIFAEQYVCDQTVTDKKDLIDYKFYCFDGEPKYCQVIQNRSTAETIDFYDEKWEQKPFVGLNTLAKRSEEALPRPVNYDKMLSLAKELSASHCFCRVDLYVADDEPKFGELTFYPASGIGRFSPDKYDELLGEMLKIQPVGVGKFFEIIEWRPIYKETELRDYKFFCSNGECKLFKIDFDRFVGHKANYYNREGELMPYGEAVCPPDPEAKIEIPSNINKMIEIAERLSTGFKLLRVDLYSIGNKILFGELTLYPASGLEKFVPDWGDEEIGSKINLTIE